jgi:nucleotide-binding universal stress UspA family protein
LPGIVCAVRGGPASQSTINRAINLAREAALPLYFIYVVNLDFLSHTASSRVHTITEEMQEMGDFILLNAREKAHAKGIDAQGVVRKGNVGEQIIIMCKEVDADYLILGQPRGLENKDVFTHEIINQFRRRIESISGAQIVLVVEEQEDE